MLFVSCSQKELDETLEQSLGRRRAYFLLLIPPSAFVFVKDQMLTAMPRASTALVPAVDLVLPVIEGSSERSNRPGRTYQFPNNAYNIHLHRESNWAQATGTYEEVMARARAGEELHIQPGEHDCVFQNSAPDRTDGDFEVAWVVLAFSLGGREFDVKAQMVAEWV